MKYVAIFEKCKKDIHSNSFLIVNDKIPPRCYVINGAWEFIPDYENNTITMFGPEGEETFDCTFRGYVFREDLEDIQNNISVCFKFDDIKPFLKTKEQLEDYYNDEIETIKKDLAYQLTFEEFDLDWFLETAKKLKEPQENILKLNKKYYSDYNNNLMNDMHEAHNSIVDHYNGKKQLKTHYIEDEPPF